MKGNLIILVFAFLVLASSACGSTTTSVPTSPPAYSITLVCQECADIGMEINIWKTPDRQGRQTVGSVPSGTKASVLGTQVLDGVKHYQVRIGSVVGWVSELMVQQ